MNSSRSLNKQPEFNVLLKSATIRAAAQQSLEFFAQTIYPGFEPANHIKLIISHLEKIKAGEIKKLIINMPPRHGKSLIATKLFPIWYLGNKPQAEVMITAHSLDLAANFTRWQRNQIDTPEYQRVFATKVRGDSQAADRWETETGGSVRAAGIGGGITGRGAHLAIIDDPIKNAEEAMSEAVLEKIWEWYKTTLLTRLYQDGAIVIVQTRWSKRDLVGRLLEQNPDGWTVLKLPAIDDDGKALWPEHFNLDFLRERQRDLEPKAWNALYQQVPIETSDMLFTRPMVREMPRTYDVKAYLDPAFGGKDYSALTIGNKRDKDLRIEFGEIWRGEIDITYNKTVEFCRQYNVRELIIESNGNHGLVAREFRNRGFYVTEQQNIRNKHLRIVDNVRKHWHSMVFSTEVTKPYMEQLMNYYENCKHDDAPDSLAGLVHHLVNYRCAGVIMGRPI